MWRQKIKLPYNALHADLIPRRVQIAGNGLRFNNRVGAVSDPEAEITKYELANADWTSPANLSRYSILLA